MSQFADPLRARLQPALGDDRFCGPDEFGPDIQPEPGLTIRVEETTELGITLAAAQELKVPVVLLGRASRIRGPWTAMEKRNYLLVSTAGLGGVEKISPESLWLQAGAGTSMQQIISRAAAHGCRPVGVAQDDQGSLGGWLASTARLPDPILGIPQPAVLGLEAVLPKGTVVRSVPTPRAAVGPDLFSLFLGTGGAFGAISAATIKLEPLPQRRLLSGFRFDEPGQAFAFARFCLGLPLPPNQAQIMIDGRAGKRMARIWMSFEGHAALAGLASQQARRGAVASGGKPRPIQRVRAWRDAASFGRRRHLEASLRWSELEDLLRRADRELGPYSFAVLDRFCLTGGRLRLALARRHRGNPRKPWARMIDPDGERSRAEEAAAAVLNRIREEIDSDGLFNPPAWPQRRPGGGA